jgi:2,3-diketo-5-methylthio-1-phosphopentane phosphatase
MHSAAECPVVFLDFDGTISRSDVVDAILERFAVDGWQRLEEAWQAGRIGSRDCLAGQIACVRASPQELHRLIDGIEIDDGIVLLLEACRRCNVDVHVISDGFDYCIDRILARLPAVTRTFLHTVSVCSSQLHHAGGTQWRTAFPFYEGGCEHGCATCKPAVMHALNPHRRPTVFVGDGLSDRYACEAADLTFAKDRLHAYCVERALSHVPFRSLSEVAAIIEDRVRAGQEWRKLDVERVRV